MQLENGTRMALTDVLHVPHLDRKLLFIPALVAKGANAQFKSTACSVSVNGQQILRGCACGKMPVAKFSKQSGCSLKTQALLELLHTDLIGTMTPLSMGGARYVLVFVDALRPRVPAQV
ncbi:TPA: hypothetical protein N0F65_000468 [Lagenidium giganteum]|uniref:Uncharacterized protein n=1 Tax=Lagenidium giganteum TaxID=4803 RepID=A0AAV2Z3D8_9STRA|nr:TPA: hypothetical protein N0F65_000468 [Lagenidium giganteum]